MTCILCIIYWWWFIFIVSVVYHIPYILCIIRMWYTTIGESIGKFWGACHIFGMAIVYIKVAQLNVLLESQLRTNDFPNANDTRVGKCQIWSNIPPPLNLPMYTTQLLTCIFMQVSCLHMPTMKYALQSLDMNLFYEFG